MWAVMRRNWQEFNVYLRSVNESRSFYVSSFIKCVIMCLWQWLYCAKMSMPKIKTEPDLDNQNFVSNVPSIMWRTSPNWEEKWECFSSKHLSENLGVFVTLEGWIRFLCYHEWCALNDKLISCDWNTIFVLLAISNVAIESMLEFDGWIMLMATVQGLRYRIWVAV